MNLKFARINAPLLIVAIVVFIIMGYFATLKLGYEKTAILAVVFFPAKDLRNYSTSPDVTVIRSWQELTSLTNRLETSADFQNPIWNDLGKTSYAVVTKKHPIRSFGMVHSSLNLVVIAKEEQEGLFISLIPGDPSLSVKFGEPR